MLLISILCIIHLYVCLCVLVCLCGNEHISALSVGARREQQILWELELLALRSLLLRLLELTSVPLQE